MKRWKNWMLALGILVGLCYMSTMPGLRTLPLFSHINAFIMRFDVYFVRAAEEIAQRLPINTGELGPFQRASNDFYVYAKANPGLIAFILRKIAHVTAFYFLTIGLFFVLNKHLSRAIVAVFSAFLLANLISVLEEFRQSFVDGRVSSAIDIGINFLGITVATLSLLFFIFILKDTTRDQPPSDHSAS